MRSPARKLKFLLVLILLVAPPSACNIYDFIDSPDGDEQILSAARACFDQGDVECAREWYEKLSDNVKDSKNSELAFALLEEQGIGMDLFITAFGEGAGAKGLSKLANLMSGPGASEARRSAIFEAYKKVDGIETQELKGLVRFVTALVFAAQLLAEDHEVDGEAGFKADDFVSNPTACKNVEIASCNDSSCGRIGGLSDSVPSSSDTALNSSTVVTGTADLTLLHRAILAVLDGLNEIDAGGKFSSGLGNFVSTVQALDGIGNATCYRYLLVKEGLTG